MEALVIDKERIKEMLDEFPESVVIEDFINLIIIAAKIEKALDRTGIGEGIDWEYLRKEMNT